MRPSTELRIFSGLGWLLAALLGLGIAATGAVLIIGEVQSKSYHAAHVYVGAGLVFFGALLIVPSAVTSGLQRIIVIIGPFLPTFGRRISDVPAPPGVPPGTPVVPPASERPTREG